jgi:sRNA-binding protein
MTLTNEEAGAAAKTATAGQPNPKATEVPTSNRSRPNPATLIEALAGLFPAAFVADRHAVHRPLKLGVHQDLVDTGVLTKKECAKVLGCYVKRPQYLKAVIRGGPRYGLSGQLCGVITPNEMKGAVERLTAHKAAKPQREARKALEARAWIKARRALRKTLEPERLSLGDLKAAAAARRAAAS